jgi:hypothetical protein
MADPSASNPQSGRLAALQSGPGPKRFAWLVSEFVVVVMGVLVAITIDGWWSDRQDREREAVYLQQLANDLARSEVELAEVSEFVRSLAVSSANVMKAFWDPALRERTELLEDLIRPHRSTRYLPITGTAQALVNSGNIDLVQSPRIRSAVIEYLEDVDATVRNIERFDETYYRPARLMGTAVSVALLTGLLQQRDGRELNELVGEDSLDLYPLVERVDTLPFEVDMAALFADRAVFERYENLVVAHRNQHYGYEVLSERAGALLALLAEEGIEPTTQPERASAD